MADTDIRTTDIADHARQLYDEFGPRAVSIAARKAREADAAGDPRTAEQWRRIEQAALLRRGPHES